MNNAERSYQRQLIAAIDAELGVRRWSRRHLADESGINIQTLDRVFLLRRDMNVEQFAAIAHALGMEPDDIVNRAKLWADQKAVTHSALVDEQSALTARQKARLKQDIHTHLTQTGNLTEPSDDVGSSPSAPARSKSRPAG